MINNYSNQLEKDVFTLFPSEVSSDLKFSERDYNLVIVYRGEKGENTISMGPMNSTDLKIELNSLKYSPKLIRYEITSAKN